MTNSPMLIVTRIPIRSCLFKAYNKAAWGAPIPAENTACALAANLRTSPIQSEVMALTSQGEASATAGQQADHPGGKNAI
jgi:hypothetical protein